MREYALPLILAVLLHCGVAAALMGTWDGDADDKVPRLAQPIIEAKLLVLERPRAKPTQRARQAPQPAAPKPPSEPKPKPEPKPKEPAPEPAEPPPDPEAERRAREEAERAKRLRELAEQSTALALEDELADLEEASAEQQAMSYMDAINRAIAAQWSRPPSARLGMTARFRVDLVPSGELLGAELMESSGNDAFDRSAAIAIRKASPFEVPPENALFEEHFRQFTLLFDPQDLLQ